MTARRILLAAPFALAIFALAPARYTDWVHGFGQVTLILIAPISHPVTAVAGWLSVRATAPPQPEQVALLTQERDRYELLYLQEKHQVEELRERVKELQAGVGLDADPSMRLITATVTGRPSDLTSVLLHVRAGSAKGVSQNTVATVQGVQLMGQVVRVSPLTCIVEPITAAKARPLTGRVMREEVEGLYCQLSPTGEGALAGRLAFVLDPRTQQPVRPEVGDVVRLDDELWPANAQMLIVGRVERVEPSPTEPSRLRVIVRPELPLEQFRGEVTLRVTTDAPIPEEDSG
ncbi:MAG: rod shape-determining protein MreC [Phycisphaerales bacterium JB039]